MIWYIHYNKCIFIKYIILFVKKKKKIFLEHIVSENTYYISSPKTIILAKPRDLEDHIEWLLEKKKYEEALIAVEQADSSYGGRSIHDIVDIGQKYMTSLIEESKK